jgi:hypothetical protein
VRNYITRTLIKLVTQAILCICLEEFAFAQSDRYDPCETGFPKIQRIAGCLYDQLDPHFRLRFAASPVILETNAVPWVKLNERTDGLKDASAVSVSTGFIELANRLAHAKAIDRYERGYFKKYVQSFGLDESVEPVPPLPPTKSRMAWSFDAINAQISQFSQLSSMSISITFAHQYLGHFDLAAKSQENSSGQVIPVNSVLSEVAWEKAVLIGAQRSLECGYAIGGLKALYEAIGEMPKRPAWAIYFVHPNIKTGKVISDLGKVERRFFSAN